MPTKKIKVLLIEDYKIDQLAFEDFLKTKKNLYEFMITGSVEEATKILNSTNFDVVIADYMLGDGTAFDLFDLIGDIPIIFVTGAGDEEVAVKAMKAGVYDYLVKDLDRQYLEKLPEAIEKAYQQKELSEKPETIKDPVNKLDFTKVTEGLIFYTSRLGPTLAYKPTKVTFTEEDYIKMGVFFYLAVGQGNVRNYGLFELPVPGFPTYRSFVYSFDVLDPTNEDPRSEGKNYCLLVLLFPTRIREYLIHPFDLENLIEENITDFTALEHLRSPEVFNRLFPHIFA
ncbi:MAG: response regulator [Promethearchaeota archaeon]